MYIKYRYLDINKSENKSLITDTKINYKEIKTHLVKKKNLFHRCIIDLYLYSLLFYNEDGISHFINCIIKFNNTF